MKKVLMTILFCNLIMSFIGCKKDTGGNNEDSAALIVGSWELRQTSGATTENYGPGNGNIFTFSDSTYEKYESGVPVKSGHYEIAKDSTAETNLCLVFSEGQFVNRIIFDSANNPPNTFIQIAGDKMTFFSGCYAYDAGHSEAYVRQ